MQTCREHSHAALMHTDAVPILMKLPCMRTKHSAVSIHSDLFMASRPPVLLTRWSEESIGRCSTEAEVCRELLEQEGMPILPGAGGVKEALASDLALAPRAALVAGRTFPLWEGRNDPLDYEPLRWSLIQPPFCSFYVSNFHFQPKISIEMKSIPENSE